MSNTLGWLLGSCLAVAAVTLHAQEMSCRQIFMNASEKRVCGTPALVQKDAEVGKLSRRVKGRMRSYRDEHRAFRKALKRCNGDDACLASLYEARIADLQSEIASLPALSEVEQRDLAEQDARAEKKREDQESARQHITAKLVAHDERMAADLAASPHEVAAEVVPAAVPALPKSSATVASPAAMEARGSTDAQSLMVSEPSYGSPSGTQPRGEPVGSRQPDEGSGGNWIAGLLAVVFGLGLLHAAWTWLKEAVRRCPRCTRWFAGALYDREQNSHTDYEMRTFKDEHRNRNNQLVGTTERKRQVAVRITETTDYLQCRHCSNRWAITSTSRR